MSKDTENFDRIMSGLGEVLDIVERRAKPAAVYVPAEIDVRAIRQARKMSQEAFAARYGFKVSTLRDWEQKRRRPEASARILLRVIERHPEAVEDALSA
jgi:putative transcriptional regulator